MRTDPGGADVSAAPLAGSSAAPGPVVSSAPPRLRLGVGIASSGRPATLLSLMRSLDRQERKPDLVVVCRDGAALPATPVLTAADMRMVEGPPGLCAKRNLILGQAAGLDVLVFFDDDFLPDVSYLAAVEAAFDRDPDLVVLTGLVLADGVNGPEIDEGSAEELIRRHRAHGPAEASVEACYNAYGCNMAVRLAPVRARGIRFDEALPLYGWLEDVDFSRRLAEAGHIQKQASLFGVHRGVKAARLSGRQFGYSQVANSLYLVRKGNLDRRSSLNQIVRNVAKNALLAARPEPWCDRRGRLRGNVLALADLLRGRLDVRRVLEL